MHRGRHILMRGGCRALALPELQGPSFCARKQKGARSPLGRYPGREQRQRLTMTMEDTARRLRRSLL